MYPSLFTIPGLDLEVKSYGVMMMLAFLIGIYLTVRRALRVHGDPDIAINMGLMSLIGGLAGARLFFVIHYWDPYYTPHWVEGAGFFRNLSSTAWAILDMRTGGLEFYGGVIGGVLLTILYLWLWAKVSVRWYLDMIAPSLMFGAMFGRVGCFLNGCCFGRTCSTTLAGGLLAVTFPYGSNASEWQWRMHDFTLPPALTYYNQLQPGILPAEYTRFTQQDVERFRATGQVPGILPVPAGCSNTRASLSYFSDHLKANNLTVDQFKALARQFPAKPVYPIQPLQAFSALTLWLLLEAVFRYRKRHGVVFLLMIMLYAISRFVEEYLRQDNPYDSPLGLTTSQGVAMGMFFLALLGLIYTYKALPLFSPKVKPVIWSNG